ncbi:MAG: hypothetical protein ABSG15_10705, partial [FCB group bacterium]
LPFIIDDQYNLVIDIKGKEVTKYLYLTYSTKHDTRFNANDYGDDIESIGIASVDDDAYIKITLSQNP